MWWWRWWRRLKQIQSGKQTEPPLIEASIEKGKPEPGEGWEAIPGSGKRTEHDMFELVKLMMTTDHPMSRQRIETVDKSAQSKNLAELDRIAESHIKTDPEITTIVSGIEQFIRYYDTIKYHDKMRRAASRAKSEKADNQQVAEATGVPANARPGERTAKNRATPATTKKKPISNNGQARAKLTPELRAQALQMRAEGKNNAEIARALGVSRSTISRL